VAATVSIRAVGAANAAINTFVSPSACCRRVRRNEKTVRDSVETLLVAMEQPDEVANKHREWEPSTPIFSIAAIGLFTAHIERTP